MLGWTCICLIVLLWTPLVRADDTASSVRAALAAVRDHPRLLLSPEVAATLPERAAADAVNARVTADLLRRADDLLGIPPVTRELQGRRMLNVSRTALDRIVTLGMAWHLRGDTRHRDRALREMLQIAAFRDWNPSHFLDVAEMTMAAAIGLDWLHAEMDPDLRNHMRNAIFELGLKPALASEDHWWIRTTNNWNQVCHGGMVAGALVLLDSHPEPAARVIERAVRHVPNAMASYAPEGAYPEGPSYWAYGTNYNVLLLAMLQTALGTSFGLEDAEGFNRTGAIPMLMTGPSGKMFNYSDGRADRYPQPAVYWLARRFGKPEWCLPEDELIVRSDNHSTMAIFSLLWREPGAHRPDPPLPPLHWTSRGHVPVSIHRESWESTSATFFGIKAGAPGASHGQMDAGSFVLDAGGVRWAHDLGMENYHHAESKGLALWNKHQRADRWKVFRNNNFSHNTLVIDDQLQNAAGHAAIIRFSGDPVFPHTVVDTTTAYGSEVASAFRGMALLPGGSVLVRDHLTGLTPGAEVRWIMMTRADSGPAGGSTLVLEENHSKLELTVHTEQPAFWEVADVSEPLNPWDSPNPEMKRVSFTTIAPASGALDLAVVLRPGGRPASRLDPLHLGAPGNWSEP